RQMQSSGASRERGVHDRGVGLEQQLAAVVAAAREIRPAQSVAQRGERGFVDLHVTASRVVKRGELVAKSVDDVLPEKIEVGINLAADMLAPGAEMQDGGRGDGHLGRARSERAEKLELGGVNRRFPFEPRIDGRNYQRQLVSLAIDEGPFLTRGVVGRRDPAQSAVKA